MPWDRIGSSAANCPRGWCIAPTLIAVDSIEVAKIEAGDLIMAPVDWNDRRIVDLAKIEQRPAGKPITIFKSCGLGVEDVAAAAYVYERLV